MSEQSPTHKNNQPVSSPFENSFITPQQSQNGKKSKFIITIALGVLAIVVIAVLSIYLFKNFNDQYRTLESFPVSKYLDAPTALQGSRFKAELRVEAELGWKDNKGRLMAFSTPNESRLIVVLMPPQMKDIYFTKGQNYLAEIEVKEGGLIHANSCRKN